jgi:hypothetical protein
MSGRHESSFDRHARNYRPPRSAHRRINFYNSESSRRITNAFGGCETNLAPLPSRTEIPTPSRRPAYYSSFRTQEELDEDYMGCMMILGLAISEIISLVGSYEVAHNLIRPNFGGDTINPEGWSLAVGAALGFAATFGTAFAVDHIQNRHRY